MTNNSIAAIAAGTLLVISLGLAGPALANDDDEYYDTPTSFAPDTYADPATEWVPWGSDQNQAVAPEVDTTVQCDGCAN